MSIRKVPVTREKIEVETVGQEFHLTLSEREFALVYYLVNSTYGLTAHSLADKLAKQDVFDSNKQPELNHTDQNCPGIALSGVTLAFLRTLSNEVNK